MPESNCDFWDHRVIHDQNYPSYNAFPLSLNTVAIGYRAIYVSKRKYAYRDRLCLNFSPSLPRIAPRCTINWYAMASVYYRVISYYSIMVLYTEVLLLQRLSKNSIRIMTWVSYYSRVEQWNVTTHRCPNFNFLLIPQSQLSHIGKRGPSLKDVRRLDLKIAFELDGFNF